MSILQLLMRYPSYQGIVTSLQRPFPQPPLPRDPKYVKKRDIKSLQKLADDGVVTVGRHAMTADNGRAAGLNDDCGGGKPPHIPLEAPNVPNKDVEKKAQAGNMLDPKLATVKDLKLVAGALTSTQSSQNNRHGKNDQLLGNTRNRFVGSNGSIIDP